MYRQYCKWGARIALLALIAFASQVQAAKSYSPDNVYEGVDYATRILDRILALKNITDIQVPKSREQAAKPMHVYELHISALNELYQYALKHNRRPPPLAVSSPIKYTPTDSYYLTLLVIRNLEELYRDSGGIIDFSMAHYSNKTPADVYQKLFELYYKLNRLNGKSKVSPSEVYSHIYRAKEDLQYTLLTLSKRLDDKQEDKKRLLVTAAYGMNPDGSVMPPFEKGKIPKDVIEKSFEVRAKLNALRAKNKLGEIKIPSINEYDKVKPIDVFLQTQFIIAELNLLKIPMGISSVTNSAKPVVGKTPSDVYQEMKHIDYMLDRLLRVL